MTTETRTESEFLAQYDIHDFEIPLSTVDTCIFTVMNEQLKVLLVKRNQHPYRGFWALPGGFIDLDKDNTLEDTAIRKLKQKTGFDSPYLEQVVTIGNKTRDPRGWSLTVLYFALVPHAGTQLIADESAEAVDWVPLDQTHKQELAFDHHKLLKLGHERLKNKALYTSQPVHLLNEEFTLPQLQRIYEVILNVPLQKKSFRKRFLDAGIIEDTGKKEPGVTRPATLYRLTHKHKVHIFPRSLEIKGPVL